MRTKGKKLMRYSSRHSLLEEVDIKLSPTKKDIRKISKRLCSSRLYSCTKKISTKKKNTLGRFIESLRKISSCSSARSQSNLKIGSKKASHLGDRNNWQNDSCDGVIERKGTRKRRRKKKRKNIVQDQASFLKRRARYLLIKMKLELSLIDAYSGDGWKGQSKEKIKPEKELQRAGKQILKCKLGIRDTIRQLDLLSSEGRIADSVMHPDGSVFHEHIFCAKCESREAFQDNDIILCDGTCNCGFHQKCLEPPLQTIPPADQGWLCKICDCKMEILEAINAHIGTSFTVNSRWEDIFYEATNGHNPGDTFLNSKEDWPSEDSNDEDYDPELIEQSNSGTSLESDDASSSSSLLCSSDEAKSCSNSVNCSRWDLKSKNNKEFGPFDSVISIDSGECSDCEVISYRRQRRDVDYKKLYNEMFGKELNENEQQSEDEDWGPQRRKRRRRKQGPGTVIANGGNEDDCTNMIIDENISCERRKLFRIPREALEKLRQVFAKNELPTRDVRENLALELGISAEKISKWFKNARYAALRNRKIETTNEPQIADSTKISRKAGNQRFDDDESMDSSFLLPLSSLVQVPRNFQKILQRNSSSISVALKKQYKTAAYEVPTDKIQVSACFGEGIYHKSEGSGPRRKDAFHDERNNDPQVNEITENELYLVELERLCTLEERLQNLKNTLLACVDYDQMPNRAHPKEENVIYVPVAEIKEKSR